MLSPLDMFAVQPRAQRCNARRWVRLSQAGHCLVGSEGLRLRSAETKTATPTSHIGLQLALPGGR